MLKTKVKTIAIAVAIVIVAIIFIRATSFNNHERIVTVIKTERVQKNDDSKYLIFCEDSDGNTVVFENTDKWIRGKFNSSDFYAQITPGETYTFTLIGYRIPIFSMYENILGYEKLETKGGSADE